MSLDNVLGDLLECSNELTCKIESYIVHKKSMEPITLDERNPRPVKFHDIESLRKEQRSRNWEAEEVDLSKDYRDFINLTEGEQNTTSNVIGFFANADDIVNENIMKRFLHEIKSPEIIRWFHTQVAMEDVHVDSYHNMLETLIRDPVQKDVILNAITEHPVIKHKLQWAKNWVHKKSTLGMCFVAWTIIEGVFFCSSFAWIFHLRRKGLLPGLGFANEQIFKDESLHVRASILIHNNYIKHKPSQEEVHELFREAVEVEKTFVRGTMTCDMKGMNQVLMCQYVENVADVLLVLLGHEKIYNTPNPFDWMAGMNLKTKDNFFEKRRGEYSMEKSTLSGKMSFDIESDEEE